MDQQGGGVAVLPDVHDQGRRGKPGSALKSGFLNKPNGRIRHNVTASSRISGSSTRSAVERHSANGGKAKDVGNNNDMSEHRENGMSDKELLPIVPQFEAAKGPELIAMDTSSMHLQWQTVRQLPVENLASSRPDIPDADALPCCEIEYCLEMRMVSTLELSLALCMGKHHCTDRVLKIDTCTDLHVLCCKEHMTMIQRGTTYRVAPT